MRKVAAGLMASMFLCSFPHPVNVHLGKRANSQVSSHAISKTVSVKSDAMFHSEEELRQFSKRHVAKVFDTVFADQQKLTGIVQLSKPSFDVVEVTDPTNNNIDGGEYLPSHELILVYQGNNRKRGMLLEYYKEKGFDEQNYRNELENLLAHEAGHHYLHTRAREIGALSYMIRPGFYRNFGPKLIDEGVSEYLGHRTRKNKILLSKADPDIFMNLQEAAGVKFYRAAFELVRPILDKDCVKGIDYLLMHPIEDTSPEGLVKYVSSATRELERLK